MFIKLMLVQLAFALSLLPGAQPTTRGLPFVYQAAGWQVEICVVDECRPIGISIHEQIDNPFDGMDLSPKRDAPSAPAPHQQDHKYDRNLFNPHTSA